MRRAGCSVQREREEYVREELTAKGIEEGIQKGIEKGVQKGQERMALRQLERKLGVLPADLTAQVQTLSSDQLMELAETLLDFTELADLTAWLATHPPAAPATPDAAAEPTAND